MTSLFEIVDGTSLPSSKNYDYDNSLQHSIVVMENVTIGYNLDKKLLDDVNFSIRENEWIAIVGGNGTGKTTLLKNILGLEKPLSGSVTVYDMPAGYHNPNIGYIPQDRDCFLPPKMSAMTLLMNSFSCYKMGLPNNSQIAKERAELLLDWVGMQEFAYQPIVSLSGGQRKRVYLAQAMINEPKMLILDEPLVNLDQDVKTSFINLLKSLHKHSKITLIMVSHDLYNMSSEFNALVHIKDKKLHTCINKDCIKEDNVSIE